MTLRRERCSSPAFFWHHRFSTYCLSKIYIYSTTSITPTFDKNPIFHIRKFQLYSFEARNRPYRINIFDLVANAHSLTWNNGRTEPYVLQMYTSLFCWPVQNFLTRSAVFRTMRKVTSCIEAMLDWGGASHVRVSAMTQGISAFRETFAHGSTTFNWWRLEREPSQS